ncbi:MAG TPA: DUF3052 domain-containing protein [Actinomycetota bacterium]|jgi:hypothetical protein
MATERRDHSGTPLPKKLGIRQGSRVLLVNAPDGFDPLLAPLPPGVQRLRRVGADLEVVVVFATRRADLERRLPALIGSLVPDGRLWVAWPKKAARVATDLTFDAVQALGLDAGLVDNKSASITDVFQGLQFVYRLKDRPAR